MWTYNQDISYLVWQDMFDIFGVEAQFSPNYQTYCVNPGTAQLLTFLDLDLGIFYEEYFSTKIVK